MDRCEREKTLHHVVQGLSREDEQFVRDSCPSVLLQDGGQVPANCICRTSVPGVVVGRLVASQDVYKALLLGAAEHSWWVAVGDVCVQGV